MPYLVGFPRRRTLPGGTYMFFMPLFRAERRPRRYGAVRLNHYILTLSIFMFRKPLTVITGRPLAAASKLYTSTSIPLPSLRMSCAPAVLSQA